MELTDGVVTAQPKSHLHGKVEPITTEPIPATSEDAGNWTESVIMESYPPGLECLSQVDHLLVRQRVNLLETFVGWEQANKYEIFTRNGQQVYYAFEESSCCSRLCCGARRKFNFHVVDSANREVLKIVRPFSCCATGGCCCLDCCHFEVTVETPDGNALAYVRSACSCMRPHYVILDGATREEQLYISGPCFCCLSCKNQMCPCSSLAFEVEDPDGEEVGKISKKWAGLGRELFSNADNFGVSFPAELDVKLKAAMLGATLLIDFMYFEDDKDDVPDVG